MTKSDSEAEIAMWLGRLQEAHEQRDRYLAALKKVACDEAMNWSGRGIPGDVFIGDILFRVTRADGTLQAEEVK